MKKFTLLFLLGILSIFVFGCGGDGDEDVCPSDLTGTYEYFSPADSLFCGEDLASVEFIDLTGNIEIIRLSEDTYTFSDWSFGVYKVCYTEGINENNLNGVKVADSKSLTFRDSCNTIIFNNTDLDRYGDLWTFDSKIEGTQWFISWENTFSESGSTILTNSTGWNLQSK